MGLFMAKGKAKLRQDINVVWCGYIYSTSGYGSVTRSYILALIKAGVKVRAVDLGGASKEKINREEVRLLENAERQKLEKGSKTVVIMQTMPYFWDVVRVRGADYKIGVTIYETDRIPKEWVGICNGKKIDRVLVPTEFNMNTFSDTGVSRGKLGVLNYCIDKHRLGRFKKYWHYNGTGPFRVLYIADITFAARKNVPALIESFTNEFDNGEDVELLLHLTSKNKGRVDEFLRKNGRIFKDGRVKVSSEPLSEDEVLKLIATADLYISVDRANGWGVPCMEAMAIGTLAATVDWSGSTEFMNRKNSLVIKPRRIVDVDEDSALEQRLYIGHKWAEVKTEDIMKTLRKAYSDGKMIKNLIKEAANDIENNFSYEKVGNEIIELLNEIDLTKNTYDEFSISENRTVATLKAARRLVVDNVNYLVKYRQLKLFWKTAERIIGRANN